MRREENAEAVHAENPCTTLDHFDSGYPARARSRNTVPADPAGARWNGHLRLGGWCRQASCGTATPRRRVNRGHTSSGGHLPLRRTSSRHRIAVHQVSGDARSHTKADCSGSPTAEWETGSVLPRQPCDRRRCWSNQVEARRWSPSQGHSIRSRIGKTHRYAPRNRNARRQGRSPRPTQRDIHPNPRHCHWLADSAW